MEDYRENFEKNAIHLMEMLNKYAAGIALAVPAFITISTSVIKYLTYIRIKGQTDYFSVPPSAIEVFNQSILFDFIFSSILFAVMLFNSYVFFLVVRRSGISFFKRITIFLVASGTVLFINSILLLTSTRPIRDAIALSIFNFLNALIFFLLRKIPQKKAKKATDNTENVQENNDESFQKKILYKILHFILTFALLGSVFYYDGQSTAEKERTFRTIDDAYIVVYENKECYYAKRCEINTDSVHIFTNVERQYLKTEIETELKTFSNVILHS